MLLLPRSAHKTPPHPLTQILLKSHAAPLQPIGTRASVRTTHTAARHSNEHPPATSVTHRHLIPSIFRKARFGGYVATRFLADANLHGHRPAVPTAPAPSLPVLLLATYPPPRFTPPCGPCLPRAAHWRAPEPCAAKRRHTDTFGVCWQCLHPLYRIFLLARRCPARHFGGNQLPDGSFGLSPLCPCPAIELNIRTAQTLRPYFSGLRSAQA